MMSATIANPANATVMGFRSRTGLMLILLRPRRSKLTWLTTSTSQP